MDRAQFLRKTCYATLALAGSCFLLSDCKPSSIIESNGEAIIPLSSFKKGNTIIFSSTTHIQKIIVIKEKDETYKALLLKCTHKGTELEMKDNMLVCPAHGSKFDLEGNVLSVPANRPLRTFPVKVESTKIIIQLI